MKVISSKFLGLCWPKSSDYVKESVLVFLGTFLSKLKLSLLDSSKFHGSRAFYSSYQLFLVKDGIYIASIVDPDKYSNHRKM